VANHLKSEAEIGENDAEIVRSVDEKRAVRDRTFLNEFPEKLPRRPLGSARVAPDVEEFVRFWIDGGVQPVTLVVELNHRLVDRDVIRATSAGRLSVGFLNPAVNRRSTPFDT
jgi:hypothetical protein